MSEVLRGSEGNPSRPPIETTSDTQPEDRALRVWIDATMPGSDMRVFGMTLLERVLRGLLDAGTPFGEVCIELAPDAPEATAVRSFLSRI